MSARRIACHGKAEARRARRRCAVGGARQGCRSGVRGAIARGAGRGRATAVAAASWSTILQINLAARLHALIDACEQGLELRSQIGTVLNGGAPPARGRQPGVPAAALHLDHGMALRSAFAAVIAIIACCAFWIGSGWPARAAAPIMAGTFCCFFATQDDPVPSIKLFLNCTVVSIPLSAFYLLVVLPAVHSFEMLALTTAPAFLLLGIYTATWRRCCRAALVRRCRNGRADGGSAPTACASAPRAARRCGPVLAAGCVAALCSGRPASRPARRVPERAFVPASIARPEEFR